MKKYKIIENDIEYEIFEFEDGTKCWYLNHQVHRKNGPAIECFNGNKYWYKYDKRHREDGPAVIFLHTNNTIEEYYLNGIHYPNVNSPEELLLASIIL
jgi:hypothetical protein